MLRRCLSSAANHASKGILQSPFGPLEYPAVPAHQFIIDGLEPNKDRVIMIDAFTKQETRGDDFIASVGKFANKFKSLGIKPGSHVAIVALNHMSYLPAKLAVIAAGGVPVLFNPLYTQEEMEKLLVLSECSYALGHMCSNDMLEEICGKLKITVLPQVEFLAEYCKDESSILPGHNGSIHDTSLMMFSSGTTGFPKAVELTHDNLNSQLASLDALNIVGEEELQEVPIFVDFLPEFHTFGSILTHYIVRNSMKRIMLPIFTPDLFMQSIQDYKAHGTAVVPPIMLMLAKMPEVANYDLSSLRLIIVGAAPLGQETEDQAMAALTKHNPTIDLRIAQGYGTTESSGASMFARVNGEMKPGSVGVIVPGQECKLVNQEDELCGANERGEVMLRGPQIMKGYFKNEKANEEAIDSEGWLRTGDIAYHDEDMDFFIVDRLKEFIKVKGFQVAPAELEATLLLHPDIQDAAVIGIPHERLGEAPKAYIITRWGAEVDEDNVKEFIASKCSDLKHLTEVEFTSDIPKLPSGKIQRRLLRDRHAKKLAQAAKGEI